MSDSWNRGRSSRGPVARNDITGDKIQTGTATEAYRSSPLWCRGMHQFREDDRRCETCGFTKAELSEG